MSKFIKIFIGSITIIVLMLSLGCTSPSEFFKESEKANAKDIFSKLLIRDTSVNFPEFKKNGLVKGKLTNASQKVLDGNFKIVFYAANGGINKIYTTPIPGSGLKPGETKVFTVQIDKFEYETYDFENDNVFEK